ncbi:MAG: tyrosine--tRNA ligase [Phycisphaerae bacterium]|nr:tyrosine--tRNA ligase [Phycisphaerae bacterium]
MPNLIEELSWRGLIHQTTADANRAVLVDHLAAGQRVVYAGFDPTAESVTIGNLIPMMMLAHVQRAGHRPIVVMGGATGMIGDPSGKSAERQLQTRETVERNIEGQRPSFARVLDFSPTSKAPAIMLNNADWLGKMTFLDMLRDVGKHFSVNMMIQKESVAARLNTREQGISYTEFSYMILQAYDFEHIHRTYGCTVQMGGSDQFGNIVAGIDLIRKRSPKSPAGDAERADLFGITAPLVTKADGSKIGKSESGAIYLGAHKTSPYAFHQFWLNASDADVVNFLKWYTFLDRATVEGLAESVRTNPGAREAQRRLADEVVRMIHGETELAKAIAAAQALFSGDVRSLDAATLKDVFAEVPRSTHARAELANGPVSLLDLLPQTSLVASKREAREFLQNGAISVNGEKAGPDRTLTTADLLHGTTILLRRGKKQWHATEWNAA